MLGALRMERREVGIRGVGFVKTISLLGFVSAVACGGASEVVDFPAVGGAGGGFAGSGGATRDGGVSTSTGNSGGVGVGAGGVSNAGAAGATNGGAGGSGLGGSSASGGAGLGGAS